ncbi:hypothetical protein BN1110_02644 [bacterium YEK0313]|nr:hypothetical protein BN1110_02644 [bacterium YEK0313]
MLPRAFYWLMLPVGLVAIAKPDIYAVLMAQMVRQPAPAAVAPPPQPAPYGPRRVLADRDGHYRVKAKVGGRTFDAMVDTGASVVALNWQTALDLNLIHPGDRMDVVMQTAAGRAHGRRVTIPRLEVEGLSVASVPAVVMPAGTLSTNLLGMSYLSRLRRFEFAQNSLVLEQ